MLESQLESAEEDNHVFSICSKKIVYHLNLLYLFI
jgi:hypothetical protein